MVGLQSLMPGQAPQGQMPGMMPQQPAPQTKPGVQALVPSLMGMGMPQLLMMFNDPNSPVPKNRVLAAMAEQQKDIAARKAVAGQMAMAQAQQQPGTVKDQVVQGAMQGAAQGYAGGGAVAFRNGGALKFQTAGAVPPGLLNPDFDEEGLPRSKDERASIIDYNERLKAAYQKQAQAQATQAQAAAATAPRPTYPEEAKQRLEQFYKFGPRGSGGVSTDTTSIPSSAPMRMQDTRGGTPEMAALAQMLGTGAAPAPAPAGPRKQAAASAASADTGLPTDTPIDTTAYRQRIENLASGIRTGSQPSEAVLSGRQGLAALAAQNIAEQRKEAQEAEAAAKAELERRLQYTRSNLFSDAQSLFRIASAIDPRRGKGMGSFAGAVSGEMEKRTAAGEEAQKAFATAQEAGRQRNALIRQAQFLEATRAHAEAVGDDATERQARQQLATLYTELEKFNVDVQQKSKDQALARYNAQSQRMGAEASRAQAGKPTDAQSKEALFRRDPKAYEAMYGSKESASVANLVRAVNSDPRLKKLAESILPDAEAQYNARYKELVATYAPELLLGAGGGGGGGALEAATAIARGGKQ